MPERAPHNFAVQYAPFAAVLAVTVIGALFPGTSTWGFNFWAQLPLWMLGLAVLAVLLSGTLPIPKRAYVLATQENLAADGTASHSVYRWVAFIAIAAVLLALLIILRSRTTLYGDGNLVVWLSTLPGFGSVLAVESHFRPLNALLYRGGYVVFGQHLHLRQDTAYGVISAIGGLVGLIGLYKLATELTRTLGSAVIVFLVAVASGCTILFFGYLEAYTWCTSALLWHIYFAIRYLRHKSSVVMVILSGLTMGLLNMVLLPVLGANLALLLSRRNADEISIRYFFGLSFRHFFIVTGVAACVVIAAVRLAFPDKVGFVLSPLPTTAYWLLAPRHLLDLLSEILLVVPFLPAVVILSCVTRSSVDRSAPAAYHVVALTALVTSLFSFWVDPRLGAPRDWDLLSLFGFPVSILVGVEISNRLTSPADRARVVLPMLLVVAVLLVPNLYEKTSMARTAERLDPLLRDDPHYTQDFADASIAFHWGTLLLQDADRGDLAKLYLARRLSVQPRDDRVWHHLGEIYEKAKNLDSAEYAFRIAFQLKPYEKTYRLDLISILQALGREPEANRLLAADHALEPQNADDAGRQGIVLGQAGRLQEALVYFRLADSLRPHSLQEKFNLGLAYSNLNQPESSIVYFKQALPLSDARSRCDIYYGLVVESIKARRADNATTYLEQYTKQCSDTAEVTGLRARISRLKASSGQVK